MPVVEQYPLALCHACTVDNDRDVLPSDIIRPNYVGESYIAMFNPSHEWYYLSDVRFDEGWLFKLFDNRAGEDGVSNSKFVPIYYIQYTEEKERKSRTPTTRLETDGSGFAYGN